MEVERPSLCRGRRACTTFDCYPLPAPGCKIAQLVRLVLVRPLVSLRITCLRRINAESAGRLLSSSCI